MSSGGSKSTSFHSSSSFVLASRSGGGSGFRNITHGAWERKGHSVSAMRRGGSSGRSSASRENPSSTALRSPSAVTGSSNKWNSSATKIGGGGKVSGGGLTPTTDVKSSSAQQGHTPLLPGSDTYVMACRDRFIGVAKSLVGEYVMLSMRDGSVHEGVLHTCTPFRDEPFSILLKHVKSKKSPNSAVQVETTLQINATDMVELHAPHFPNVLQSVNRPSGFATDSDISGVALEMSRTLERVDSAWVAPLPAGSGQMGSLGSSSTTNGKKWDQFEANEKLYGVVARFDENLYTTQLDKVSLTWNQQYRAEQIAREIESKESHNPHIREERNQVYEKDMDGGEMNEEIRYSRVQRNSSTRSLGSPRARNNNSPSSTCNGHGSPPSSIRYGHSGSNPSNFDGDGRSSSFSARGSRSSSTAPLREGHVSPSTRNNSSHRITTTSPRGSPLSGGSEKVYRPPSLRGQNQNSSAAAMPIVVGKTTRNAEYEAEHQLQQVLDGKLSSRAASSSQPSPCDENNAPTTESPTSETTAPTTTRDSEGKKKKTETVAAVPQLAKPAGCGEGEKKSEKSTVLETTPAPTFDSEGGGGNAAAASKKLINNRHNTTEKDGKIQSSSSRGGEESSNSTKKNRSSSLLNPNAKEFKMNPNAKTFTPGHIGGGEERSTHVGEVRAAPVTDGIVTTPQSMVMPVSAVTMVYPQGLYPSQQPMVFSQGGQQMQVAPVINMGHVPYDVGGHVPMIQGYGGYPMGYSPQGGGGTAAAISMPLEGSGMLPTGTSFHPPSPMQHATGVSLVSYSPRQSIAEDHSSSNNTHHLQDVGKGVHHHQSNQ